MPCTKLIVKIFQHSGEENPKPISHTENKKKKKQIYTCEVHFKILAYVH